MDVASIFVVFFHPGIPCLTQQKWKGPVPSCHFASRAHLGGEVGAGSKNIGSMRLGVCS